MFPLLGGALLLTSAALARVVAGSAHHHALLRTLASVWLALISSRRPSSRVTSLSLSLRCEPASAHSERGREGRREDTRTVEGEGGTSGRRKGCVEGCCCECGFLRSRSSSQGRFKFDKGNQDGASKRRRSVLRVCVSHASRVACMLLPLLLLLPASEPLPHILCSSHPWLPWLNLTGAQLAV